MASVVFLPVNPLIYVNFHSGITPNVAPDDRATLTDRGFYDAVDNHARCFA